MANDANSGAGSFLGRLLIVALAAGAGVGGWLGAEEYALAEPDTTLVELPALGDGLPTARLVEPSPWRQFKLTYAYETYNAEHWFDLDASKIRTSVITEDNFDQIEIQGDRSFRRLGQDAEWMELDAASTRSIASFVTGGIGPFLLTDLMPPNTSGFTSLELEGTSRGERVYEVTVDEQTLQNQHPLAYERWISSTRIVTDGGFELRIRVREDGHIVRIEGEKAAMVWEEIPIGVRFESPLVPAGASPIDPTLVEPIDPNAPIPSTVPGEVPAPVDAPAPVTVAPDGN